MYTQGAMGETIGIATWLQKLDEAATTQHQLIQAGVPAKLAQSIATTSAPSNTLDKIVAAIVGRSSEPTIQKSEMTILPVPLSITDKLFTSVKENWQLYAGGAAALAALAMTSKKRKK